MKSYIFITEEGKWQVEMHLVWKTILHLRCILVCHFQPRLRSYIELLGDFLLLSKWFFLSPIFKEKVFIFAFRLIK